jgi:hypothetical protein
MSYNIQACVACLFNVDFFYLSHTKEMSQIYDSISVTNTIESLVYDRVTYYMFVSSTCDIIIEIYNEKQLNRLIKDDL